MSVASIVIKVLEDVVCDGLDRGCEVAILLVADIYGYSADAMSRPLRLQNRRAFLPLLFNISDRIGPSLSLHS